MIEVDVILAKCGDFSRFQIILLFLFCIINVLSSMHYFSQTIISFVPEHWCYNETLTNLTTNEFQIIFKDIKNPSCTQLNGETGCTKWIYNYDFQYKSIISDLNWVCESNWKSTLGQSMFFIGSMLGTLIFGILADHFGRLPILIISNIVAMIGNLATMFTTTVTIFATCRFISGLATDSNFVMMYILVMEYIRPSMRTVGLSVCIGVFYCLGSVISPWLAVAVGHWKMYLLITALPLLIVPTFYLIVPESAQWLITSKKYDKAVHSLKRIAKMNGKHVDDAVFDEFITKCTKSMVNTQNKSNILGLFKTPRLRKNTMILFFKSMVITLCYDAISRNVQGLGISPFIVFSLSASTILPACFILILLQDRIGRKAMASSSLLLSGIFTAASGVIVFQQAANNPVLLVSLAMIGRFGVTVAYNSAAQYATELIPTCVRGQGVAAVHVAGYAFTFFSSYILYLQQCFAYLPALILGGLSLLGAGLCLLLPETLNKSLPCTLEAAEEFGRNEKIFHFSCMKTIHSTSTATLGEENSKRY